MWLLGQRFPTGYSVGTTSIQNPGSYGIESVNDRQFMFSLQALGFGFNAGLADECDATLGRYLGSFKGYCEVRDRLGNWRTASRSKSDSRSCQFSVVTGGCRNISRAPGASRRLRFNAHMTSTELTPHVKRGKKWNGGVEWLPVREGPVIVAP